jgi:hypothetical protein
VRPRVRDTANENTRVARRDAPAMRHNARHQRGQVLSMLLASVFLKTIIPSRKATKQYLGEESDDHED